MPKIIEKICLEFGGVLIGGAAVAVYTKSRAPIDSDIIIPDHKLSKVMVGSRIIKQTRYKVSCFFDKERINLIPSSTYVGVEYSDLFFSAESGISSLGHLIIMKQYVLGLSYGSRWVKHNNDLRKLSEII